MSKLFNRFNVALALALISITIVGFAVTSTGDRLPAHWNIDGVVDRTAPRWQVLLMLPLVAAVMAVFFEVLRRASARKAGGDTSRVLGVSLSLVLSLFVAIQAMTLLVGTSYEIDVPRVLAVISAVGFMALGNILPKTGPHIGQRQGHADAPFQAYRAQWLNGFLMMLGGLVLLVAALTVASSRLLTAFQIGCPIAAAVLSIVYTFAMRATAR